MIDKDMLESVKALMTDKLVNAVNLILNSTDKLWSSGCVHARSVADGVPWSSMPP